MGKTLASKALESCSNAQKTWQALESARKKILGFWIFVSDVISGVVLGLFGQFHLAQDPNH